MIHHRIPEGTSMVIVPNGGMNSFEMVEISLAVTFTVILTIFDGGAAYTGVWKNCMILYNIDVLL